MLYVLGLSLIIVSSMLCSSAAVDCSGASDCISCTHRRPTKCGWCLRDGKCRDTSAAGPCTSETLIMGPIACGNHSKLSYDEELAETMAYFAAAAYSEEPRYCMMSLNSPYRIYDVIREKIDSWDDLGVAFIAKSPQNNGIVVSYRGTDMNTELLLEVLKDVIPTEKHAIAGRVASYFYDAHKALWPRVKRALQGALKGTTEDCPVYFTGHSLGGAVASLASMQAVYEKVVTSDRLKLLTFGQPRVGNYKFAMAHDLYVPYSWRIVHHRDLVAHIPLCVGLFKCSGWLPIAAYHHGVEVFYPNVDMNSTLVLEHRVCYGDPINEDQGCSNGLVTRHPCINLSACTDDHVHYFDMHLANFGLNNCTGIIKVRCKVPGC